MAHDRRSGAAVEPPRALLVFEESAWAGEPNSLEDPRRAKGRPHIRWCAARRKWLREHCTVENFNRLHDDDVEWPDVENPRIDRDITAILCGFPDLVRRYP